MTWHPAKKLRKKIKKTLCRVPPRWDTRQRNYKKNKNIFAGCLPGTAPGKENLKKKIKKIFAGCLWYGTRQSKGWRSRRRNDHFSLPGAGFALGKVFAGCPIKSTRQRNLCRLTFCRRLFAECKVAFAGCIRHPAKRLNPDPSLFLSQFFTNLLWLDNI